MDHNFKELINKFFIDISENDRKETTIKMKFLYMLLYDDRSEISDFVIVSDRIISFKVEKDFYDSIILDN